MMIGAPCQTLSSARPENLLGYLGRLERSCYRTVSQLEALAWNCLSHLTRDRKILPCHEREDSLLPTTEYYSSTQEV